MATGLREAHSHLSRDEGKVSEDARRRNEVVSGYYWEGRLAGVSPAAARRLPTSVEEIPRPRGHHQSSVRREHLLRTGNVVILRFGSVKNFISMPKLHEII